MAICPNCGNTTGENAVFCDRCGARLLQPEAGPPPPTPPAEGVICPACGASNVPGEAFCDFCGSPLAAPVPVETPAAPEAAPEATAAPAETPAAPEAAPEAAAAPAETPAAPAEQGLTCPACHAPVLAGEVFCPNCGASLAQPPLPPEPVPEAPVEAPPSPLVPELVAPPAPEAAPPPVTKCPVCNVDVEPGDTFCSNCGASLKAAPAPAVAPAEAAPSPSPAAVGPRLVVVASGAEIPLPAKAEILLGREDPVSGIFPDVDMTPHGGDEGGISRRHARMIVDGGLYFVEDLDSTNYTYVNKQKLVSKTPQVVSDGDEIRLGRVSLVFKM
ncbi:MAG: zinc ribbon domain-containing protein [Anaerolineae bacterium]|nr:zinc ribbon domain-containing protein [Anaerolineae bacterium]